MSIEQAYDFFDEGKLQTTYTATENTYNELLELYKPKDYLFEKAITFDATNIKGSNNQRLNSQLGMWMSLKRAWDLLEESGINTMGQLRNLKRSYLQSIPGLGTASINSIKAKLIELYETDDPVLASINVRLERIERMLERL